MTSEKGQTKEGEVDSVWCGKGWSGVRQEVWSGVTQSKAILRVLLVSIWERQRNLFLPQITHLHLLLISADSWDLFVASLI